MRSAFAVAKNDTASARALLAAGLDPDFTLPSGNKVLMMAMAFGHTEAAGALLDAGADITRNRSCRQYAAPHRRAGRQPAFS